MGGWEAAQGPALGWAGQLWGPGRVRSPQRVAGSAAGLRSPSDPAAVSQCFPCSVSPCIPLVLRGGDAEIPRWKDQSCCWGTWPTHEFPKLLVGREEPQGDHSRPAGEGSSIAHLGSPAGEWGPTAGTVGATTAVGQPAALPVTGAGGSVQAAVAEAWVTEGWGGISGT